jgi:hypothetical protein
MTAAEMAQAREATRIRLARAHRVRPRAIAAWDYWEEYVPAARLLTEVPLVDEMFFLAFCKGGKKQGARPVSRNGPTVRDKAERVEIVESLKARVARLKGEDDGKR